MSNPLNIRITVQTSEDRCKELEAENAKLRATIEELKQTCSNHEKAIETLSKALGETIGSVLGLSDNGDCIIC